jgi:hypothetical protein
MRNLLTMALLASLTLTNDALAQKMRDFSMSPEESQRVPSTSNTNSNNPVGGNYDQYMQQQQQGGNSGDYSNYQRASRGGSGIPGQPASNFMQGYCDPNFKPIVNAGNIANLQACIETRKQQTCEQFAALPNDVKNSLDFAIECAYTAANGGEMDENGYIAQQAPVNPACAGTDSERMALLKKHWRDQNVSYSIVFMVDQVINATAGCVGGR